MPAELPPDHAARMVRATLALDGLSVGDAFGQRFFAPAPVALQRIALRAVPRGPWEYTDDTEMALAIHGVLGELGAIDREALALRFAARYVADPVRGYGPTAHGILQEIDAGVPWAVAAGRVFDGTGSMGNGGAMRVAPLGAYFADDLDAVVAQAAASADPTHAHPEGRNGAIATALAAAYAWRVANDPAFAQAHGAAGLLAFVHARTPAGETRDGIATARELGREATGLFAAEVLGAGWKVTAPDTVPFSLWCADRHLDDYEEALWTTVEGLGDRDTTCAIVGGIVALRTGREGIPSEWLREREPLCFEVRPREEAYQITR